jgi:hypothetical protein
MTAQDTLMSKNRQEAWWQSLIGLMGYFRELSPTIKLFHCCSQSFQQSILKAHESL